MLEGGDYLIGFKGLVDDWTHFVIGDRSVHCFKHGARADKDAFHVDAAHDQVDRAYAAACSREHADDTDDAAKLDGIGRFFEGAGAADFDNEVYALAVGDFPKSPTAKA